MNDPSNPTRPERHLAPRLFLLYHEIRSSETAYPYVTNTEVFGRHLDLYGQIHKSSGVLSPELTFDDGHSSNLKIASPMIVARDLTARFFITVGWTGTRPGYMGWNDLRALLQAGHTVGAHGLTHKLLTHCNQHELRTELLDARLMLEDHLAAPITTLSLPGGRYNRRVLDACQQFGYTRIYTSAPKAESLPLGTTVGRLNIRGDMQPEWLAQLFAPNGRLLQKIEQQHRRKEAVKKMLGDRLYAKLWAIVNRQEAEPGEDPYE